MYHSTRPDMLIFCSTALLSEVDKTQENGRIEPNIEWYFLSPANAIGNLMMLFPWDNCWQNFRRISATVPPSIVDLQAANSLSQFYAISLQLDAGLPYYRHQTHSSPTLAFSFNPEEAMYGIAQILNLEAPFENYIVRSLPESNLKWKCET